MKRVNDKNASFLIVLAFLMQFMAGCASNRPISYSAQIHPIAIKPVTQNPAAISRSFDDSTVVCLQTDEGAIILTMKDYLIGVLQGELPSYFSLQTMKAQAVAARTVALKKLKNGQELCNDPDCCQAYIQKEPSELVRRAVEETDGEILCYEDSIIEAVYFSCSGGMTEAAVDVWGNEVAYLQAVASPGEDNAPRFEQAVTLPRKIFLQSLQTVVPTVARDLEIADMEFTAGGGIKTIKIGSEEFTGLQIRALFSLPSTCFEIEVGEHSVRIQSRGFGHRVGMSQYGAQAMAENGADYREILSYYYNGTEIKKQS